MRFEYAKKPPFKTLINKEPIMKTEDLKDIAIRAVKTFVFAYIAALAVVNEPVSKNAQLAAIATAIGAVFNSLNKAYQATKE